MILDSTLNKRKVNNINIWKIHLDSSEHIGPFTEKKGCFFCRRPEMFRIMEGKLFEVLGTVLLLMPKKFTK